MQRPEIGVVVVLYRSADVLVDCVESLLASQGVRPRIVLCDNASPDDGVARLRALAAARGVALLELAEGEAPPAAALPEGGITLLRLSVNGGFAAGANAGLRLLLSRPEVGLFWVLNPDCVVGPDTAAAFVRCARAGGPFSLMGGRVVFMDPPQAIQSDGARVGRWTGVVRSVNQGRLPAGTPPPDPAELDIISGANMVASRAFIEAQGLMEEGYFLYYEEVEWAFRRGALPLRYCPEAVVHHHGGTAIGSGSPTRAASGFANYFNYRNRMRFAARCMPQALPGAYLYSMAKVGQMLLQGRLAEAQGALWGVHQLPPPAMVRDRLSPGALARVRGHAAVPERISGRG